MNLFRSVSEWFGVCGLVCVGNLALYLNLLKTGTFRLIFIRVLLESDRIFRLDIYFVMIRNIWALFYNNNMMYFLVC